MPPSQKWKRYANVARTESAYVLSVLTKRTYAWNPSGAIRDADEQKPIALDVEHESRDETRNCTMLKHGTDVWPLKVATDVVVTGHVHTPGGNPLSQMSAGVTVGAHRRTVAVFGPRYVQYAGKGRLSFSSPELFSQVELSWWNAYGGVDPTVLPRNRDDTPTFCGKVVLELFPGTYPRNPCGVGYLIQETPEIVDGMALPQIETPGQLLTPETFLVRDPREWWRRPPPAGFGWYHTLWFPRIIHTSGKPYYLPPPGDRSQRLRELDLGLLTEPQVTDETARLPNLRVANEAAPDMILPYLRGDERIRLDGFDPGGVREFPLPTDRAVVSAIADGQVLTPTLPCLHTLAIDADTKEFYVLWSNRFALPDSVAVDLLDDMPVEQLIPRCEVLVDGVALEAEEWPHTPTDDEDLDISHL